MSIIRTRWAAIGAAVAVTLGAGGIGIVSATQPSDAATFVPVTPCRVMDTRSESNVGPKTSPLDPGEVYTVNTTAADTGNCTGIPTTATGVSLNITALDATMPTFLTVWATGAPQPEASSLNPVPGAPPTPNAVTTGIDTNGRFDIYNLQGNVHVIADINGYYTDHHHDDRYYTKAEVDGAIATLPWNESLPIQSAFTEGGAAYTIGGGGSITGLWMPPSVFSRVGVGWTLPPEYVPGTSLRIRMTWARRPGTVGSCTFRLRANGTSIFREGSNPLYPDSGFAPDTPGTNLTGSTALMPYPTTDAVQQLVIDIPGTMFDGSPAMQPGDHMSYLFFRDGTNADDTCTGVTQTFVVLGMSVEPF